MRAAQLASEITDFLALASFREPPGLRVSRPERWDLKLLYSGWYCLNPRPLADGFDFSSSDSESSDGAGEVQAQAFCILTLHVLLVDSHDTQAQWLASSWRGAATVTSHAPRHLPPGPGGREGRRAQAHAAAVAA